MSHAFCYDLNYEMLEFLGDSINDFLVNSNLIRYTLFTENKFTPYDAHHAKSFLAKNWFLSNFICAFGIQKYILFYDPKIHKRKSKH